MWQHGGGMQRKDVWQAGQINRTIWRTGGRHRPRQTMHWQAWHCDPPRSLGLGGPQIAPIWCLSHASGLLLMNGHFGHTLTCVFKSNSFYSFILNPCWLLSWILYESETNSLKAHSNVLIVPCSDADWTALDRFSLRSDPRTTKIPYYTLQKPVLDWSIRPRPQLDSPDYLYYFNSLLNKLNLLGRIRKLWTADQTADRTAYPRTGPLL